MLDFYLQIDPLISFLVFTIAFFLVALIFLFRVRLEHDDVRRVRTSNNFDVVKRKNFSISEELWRVKK